ncbi:MAG TPA: Re/Si-specific NAD(P)(+) transhydrogenase subunit alpha [Elusimicrobiota bacterium]|nr:Re/Si-specific NAD(P)(+) transhydrogenase subunit alpha [Elusimicrobiota bacterium]
MKKQGDFVGIIVAIPKETAAGEHRVALVPEVAGALVKKGIAVLVEAGAGASSYYPDALYSAAKAEIVSSRRALLEKSSIVLKVQPPTQEEIAWMRPGTVVVSFINPSRNSEIVRRMRDAQITAFAMELIPRITRAQSMDALSSQATAAGYKAALLAAEHSPKFFPMLTTAAGTVRPAKVLVLGAGVAGLMAIATARRLGAVVEAYDVRRAAGEHVRALGAKFLELALNAEASGGYARDLTAEEKAQERAMVAEAVARADAVITTANIPGRKAPRLIDREMASRMQPGSVIVDLAAESGGNCELTQPGKTAIVGGVIVLGPENIPSQIPFHSSRLYAKNQQAFLELLIGKDGALNENFSDEILAAALLVHQGRVAHEPTRELVETA